MNHRQYIDTLFVCIILYSLSIYISYHVYVDCTNQICIYIYVYFTHLWICICKYKYVCVYIYIHITHIWISTQILFYLYHSWPNRPSPASHQTHVLRPPRRGPWRPRSMASSNGAPMFEHCGFWSPLGTWDMAKTTGFLLHFFREKKWTWTMFSIDEWDSWDS